MANVQVDYDYTSRFRCYITIHDSDIDEVIEEWRQDHIDDWEPTADYYEHAIHILLEEKYAEYYEPMSDEEIGFGDFDDFDTVILEPYAGNVREEITGQLTLEEQELSI